MAEHIFLVDDEMLINMGLHSFLTKNGYTSSMFGSGEDCLEALAEGNLPDVILMDINFGPGRMGGPEATMLINARYDIPVILHSAYTGKETLDQTKEMTRYGYIQKFPGNEQFVLANIEMAIKLYRSKKLYREMFQNSNDAIFLHTIDKAGLPGKFYEVNDVACRYLGYSREELLQMSPADIDSGTDKHEILEIMRELAREKRITFEMNHRAKDGTIVPVEISSHLFILHKQPNVISSVRDISKRKEMETELRERERMYRELSTHHQNIREEQNAYIAREIHDDLGQSLTALKMNLTMIENAVNRTEAAPDRQNLNETIVDMKQILNGVVGKVRALTKELRPPVLDTMGIIEALRWHALDFEKQFNLPIGFHSQIAETELGKEKSLAVFRIVQEALTNSIKHASPTELGIEISRLQDTLSVAIQDNGTGFSEPAIRTETTYGLLGMRERARQIGGNLSITSSPGRGTTVELFVPAEESK